MLTGLITFAVCMVLIVHSIAGIVWIAAKIDEMLTKRGK